MQINFHFLKKFHAYKLINDEEFATPKKVPHGAFAPLPPSLHHWADIKRIGHKWKIMEKLAQDRDAWRSLEGGLCPWRIRRRRR